MSLDFRKLYSLPNYTNRANFFYRPRPQHFFFCFRPLPLPLLAPSFPLLAPTTNQHPRRHLHFIGARVLGSPQSAPFPPPSARLLCRLPSIIAPAALHILCASGPPTSAPSPPTLVRGGTPSRSSPVLQSRQ